ncbi:hypothetical protein RirG_004360 [Rhizophagus irregularis DAOM 197198w]|uniref:Uncharacterized protein n=1 Tax=Rhizophagus irregularis (strain DAOM 197198w) TaxID=1432141 RepID=A0A015KCQ1_RHIIW|nr:hypothetical protein RirG_004360 [Rhizophagus irregularis DAOM 197198w]
MDQWTAFADDLDKLCPIDPLVFDAWPLNQKCEYLHSRIIKAAKSQLPSVTVGNTYAPKKRARPNKVNAGNSIQVVIST